MTNGIPKLSYGQQIYVKQCTWVCLQQFTGNATRFSFLFGSPGWDLTSGKELGIASSMAVGCCLHFNFITVKHVKWMDIS
jgi:hypothetical protein